MRGLLGSSFTLLLVVACGGAQTTAATSTTDAGGATCKPLASFADACPADWAGAKADKGSFCASRQMPDFDALSCGVDASAFDDTGCSGAAC